MLLYITHYSRTKWELNFSPIPDLKCLSEVHRLQTGVWSKTCLQQHVNTCNEQFPVLLPDWIIKRWYFQRQFEILTGMVQQTKRLRRKDYYRDKQHLHLCSREHQDPMNCATVMFPVHMSDMGRQNFRDKLLNLSREQSDLQSLMELAVNQLHSAKGTARNLNLPEQVSRPPLF